MGLKVHCVSCNACAVHLIKEYREGTRLFVLDLILLSLNIGECT